MNCLCAATRRAARLLTQAYEAELSQAGLTAAQFELLGGLHARPGLSQGELAHALGLNQTTLSRNLNVLIRRKWIERLGSEQDRRQAAYSMTAAGEDAWRRALPHWKRAQSRVRQALGPQWPKVWSALEILGKTAAS